MIQPCPFCGYVPMDDLVVLAKDDALDKAKPPTVHGHRLWRVASASSWWFYRAPDREALREMFAWSMRAYSAEKIACCLATYADVRLCVDDSPAGDQR